MMERVSDPLLVGLPPKLIAVSEWCVEPGGRLPDVPLHPDEESAVERAVERRRQEFAAGRACARVALRSLGGPMAPILPDVGAKEAWARRAPIWPQGFTGSLTHCDGYVAAAVAHQGAVVSVGIDAEPLAPLPEGVEDRVALSEEREMLTRLAARRADVSWDRLLFSAKESVFKAWFPLTARWLDFEACRLEITEGGAFNAQLLVPGPVVGGVVVQVLEGRWRVTDRHIGTVVVVPAVIGATGYCGSQHREPFPT